MMTNRILKGRLIGRWIYSDSHVAEINKLIDAVNKSILDEAKFCDVPSNVDDNRALNYIKVAHEMLSTHVLPALERYKELCEQDESSVSWEKTPNE